MFLAYLLINLVNCRFFVTFSCSFQKKSLSLRRQERRWVAFRFNLTTATLQIINNYYIKV